MSEFTDDLREIAEAIQVMTRNQFGNVLSDNAAKINQAADLINKQQAEIERLRSALAEYADHDNWSDKDGDTRPNYLPHDRWERDANGWETAENALKGDTTE